MAGGALPGSSHAHDAQLLGSERSHDGADANGDVCEECEHARRRAADFPIWSGRAESGCPEKFCPMIYCSPWHLDIRRLSVAERSKSQVLNPWRQEQILC